MAEVGSDSLEWLLKRLSALAELTHKLAKKLWALWLGLGGVALAGHSGQAQAALGPFALAVSGGSRLRGFLSDAGRKCWGQFTRQAEFDARQRREAGLAIAARFGIARSTLYRVVSSPAA